MICILLSGFVGSYSACTNMHGVSNIKHHNPSIIDVQNYRITCWYTRCMGGIAFQSSEKRELKVIMSKAFHVFLQLL
jgi:hypothetical protein